MKVLIIDDEKSIVKMYEEYLKTADIDVVSAFDGQTGIDLAKAHQPDVILLDIIMPKLNGLDVLSKMKADPDIKNIPVFLLTNLPAECSGDKAKELGAAGYLVKAQYEPKMILDIVKSAATYKQNPNPPGEPIKYHRDS